MRKIREKVQSYVIKKPKQAADAILVLFVLWIGSATAFVIQTLRLP
jgi:hypothetical protein